jgi:hypothetical protein
VGNKPTLSRNTGSSVSKRVPEEWRQVAVVGEEYERRDMGDGGKRNIYR